MDLSLIKISDDQVEIAYAKDSTTYCQECKHGLDKGELRITHKLVRPNFTGNRSIWYCTECVLFSDEPVRLNDVIPNRRTVYSSQPNYYTWSMQQTDKETVRMYMMQTAKEDAEMKRSKHIFQMNIRDLKCELKKRRLVLRGNKSKLQDRLRRHLDNNEFFRKYQKQQDAKCIVGFCREFEKKRKKNVPIVLQAIIQKYFPVVIL